MYRISAPRAWRAVAVAATFAFLLPGGAQAEQIKLNVGLSHPFLLAQTKQTCFLKVSLTGFELPRDEKRPLANVALVIDKSGSMTGEKIRKAKEAAILAVNMLDPGDIVSVVAYDSTVSVLVPATRASDRPSIITGIERLSAGGNTALFAGVSKGAAEVRKFLDKEHINRVVLLSDGLANVGPSSPHALGDLAASLIKEGISVTTLGLGLDYNEDLMTQLAVRSDGDHAFIEKPADLTRLFRMEFEALFSIVAQDVQVRITCADGIRPVRTLGPDAEISEDVVLASFNLVYSNHEEYILLEVELPAMPDGTAREIAAVEVTYSNMQTKTTEKLSSTVSTRFTASPKVVAENTSAEVMVSAAAQLAALNGEMAVKLRDLGKVEEARKLLIENAAYLSEKAKKYQSPLLEKLEQANKEDAQRLERRDWDRRRKMIRDRLHEIRAHPRL